MAKNGSQDPVPVWVIILTFALAFFTFYVLSWAKYNDCVDEGWDSAYCAEAYDFVRCEMR